MKKHLLPLILSLCFVSLSHAADTKKTKSPSSTKMDWSSVQRENMAKMHENMASCLRSTKSVNDCRAEMKTSCHDMGKDCPMMMMHERDRESMHEEY